MSGDRIFADDTPLPVLDPGLGRTKTGRLWAYTRDDRSHGGNLSPAVLFHHEPDRTAARRAEHLKTFHGILQVDDYAGFEGLAAAVPLPSPHAGRIRGGASTSCTRRFLPSRPRRSSGSASSTGSRPRSGAGRRTSGTLRLWTGRRLSLKPSAHGETCSCASAGRSRLAAAIRYALGRWSALIRFLDDGRIYLANNPVEPVVSTKRDIRPNNSP